jgi:hypothetical protein
MTGWLYHLEDKKATPEELVRRAVKHYNDKFGTMPTHCQVSTRQTQFDELFRDGAAFSVDGVSVERRRSVLLNHYFLHVKIE